MAEPGLRRRDNIFARRPPTLTAEYEGKIEQRRAAASTQLRGVTTSAGLVPGLYPLRAEGLDTRPIVRAVEDHLAGLTPDQLAEGCFPLGDPSWRHWTNGARYFLRHGICLEDLDAAGRDRALAVVRESLSPHGYGLVRDLMRINHAIGEIRGELDLLNEWLYWFSVYGEPGAGRAWGWQLDGHHVNVNCVFVGDQMVLTPTFLGAEPVTATTGTYAGTTVLRPEEAGGVALFTSLDERQQEIARIGDALPDDLFTGAFRDNAELDYQGIAFAALGPDQRARADDLLATYIGRAREEHAHRRWREVLAHTDETWFAWIGDPAPGGVFYYRIHSPVILVEFEHQAGLMFDNDHRTRDHVHTVVRTPNGNDYGADLLRQHHERFRHGPEGHVAR